MRTWRLLALLGVALAAGGPLAGLPPAHDLIPAAAAAGTQAPLHIHMVCDAVPTPCAQGPFAYDPDPATVQSGNKVVWHDHSGASHTATDCNSDPCDYNEVAEPNRWKVSIDPNGEADFTFNVAPINYNYYCNNHPAAQMAAAILHVENDAPSASITDPAGGTVRPGTAVVQGTASDPDNALEKVEVRIGGGDWKLAQGTGAWSIEVEWTGHGNRVLDARATDEFGKVSPITSVTVLVNAVPDAEFTWSPTSPAAGESVSFQDASADDHTITWSWAFGDGGASSQQNPAHAYAAAGTYTVQLTVTDDHSEASTAQQSVTVVAPGQEPPVANFTVNPARPRVGSAATFSSTATDPDGSIAAWSWEFGDGGNATGSIATHTYAAAGNHTVNLTVTDNSGLRASISKRIEVVAVVGEPPTATLSANITRGTAPLLVRFTLGASDPDGSIQKFVLDYGDGNQTPGPGSALPALGSPVHNYLLPGNLTATFTVTDNDGNEVSQVVMLQVGSRRPIADFLVRPGPAVKKLDPVRFVDASRDLDQGDAPVRWAWDFGDGATDCCEHTNVTHAYLRAGAYNATLRVTDRHGVDSEPRVIAMSVRGTPPLLALSANATEGRAPFPVTFTLGAQDLDGRVARWSLNFGDGTTPLAGTGNPPEAPVRHVYERSGRSFAALRAVDDDDLEALAIVNVTIAEAAAPLLDLGGGAIRAVPMGERLTWRFTATTGFEGDASYVWAFGDGGTAAGREVVYSFRAPGTYNVTLRVSVSGSPAAEARATLDVTESTVQPQARLRAETSNGVVRLSWDQEPRASGYQVWRQAGSERTVQAGTTLAGSFSDGAVQDSVTYTYTVTFYSPDGSGLLERLSELNRTTEGFRVLGELKVEAKVDRDNDGVRDALDKYPDDPQRSPGMEAAGVALAMALVAAARRRARRASS